ncbi:MAG TPA: thioredoxin-like domain-containing protein [Vicinamibacterales bacterium]|nr:thioredoxin-like domain-containing protein [Vicinamibacterales bacterium]
MVGRRVVLSALVVLLPVAASAQTLVRDVRAAIARNDLTAADALVAGYRAESGTTPEALAALSWLGRGALAARDYDSAAKYSRDTERLTLETLKAKPLASDPFLVTALGASLETQAKVLAETGQRASAVKYLTDAIARYRGTPVHSRLTKNLNLISLEGQPAPRLTAKEFLGPAMPELKGHPVVLFFWAHWCPDCKAQAPILGDIERDYRDTGLLVVGPTRHYGYVAGGAPATPALELAHIDQVRKQFYAMLPNMAVPVSDEDAVDYGMDATPTIVLLDRAGIVRMFHPGQMTREELEPRIRALVAK